MPLVVAPEGAEVEVKKITADDAVCRRLRELGIYAGARLKVLSRRGGLVVAVKEGRLCLDASTAARITVTEAD